MLPLFQKVLTTIGIIALISACTVSSPTQFYVLETQRLPGVVAADGPKKCVIGIGPISIPALLERKQIITRSDQNTVHVAEFHQWAAPLRDNIAEVLTQNLVALQTQNVIRGYPWSAYGTVNYRLIVEIDRFDTQPGHTVILEARWAIRNEKTQAIVLNNQTRIEHSLSDTSYAATVKALSRVLYEFSQQLALAIDHLS
jgi:uncharacterized lipoprotein YmbA